MVRNSYAAASFSVLCLISADVLLIGATGMWPKVRLEGPAITVVPLAPPPAAPPAETVADVPERKPPPPVSDQSGSDQSDDQIGVASWYGDAWQGRVMASGKPFDDHRLTAAHRTLPLNSRVRVTNLQTGRSVEVTITDRGPYTHGRVIDLSEAAAKKIGMVKKGLVPVRIESVS